jgi:hypothetical protein
MAKKITYPTWAYKSQLSYARVKYRHWQIFLKSLYKLQNGSAWLPKEVRDVIMDAVKEDQASQAMEKFMKKIKQQHKKSTQ